MGRYDAVNVKADSIGIYVLDENNLFQRIDTIEIDDQKYKVTPEMIKAAVLYNRDKELVRKAEKRYEQVRDGRNVPVSGQARDLPSV